MTPEDFHDRAPKLWLKSTGVMGSIVSLIIAIGLNFTTNGEIPPAEAAALIGLIVSSLIGLYGRWTAKRPVSF